MWCVGVKNIYSEKLAENVMTFQGRDSRDKHKISSGPWRIATHKKNYLHSHRAFIHTALYCLSFTFFQTHTRIDSRLPCKGASVSIRSILGFFHKDTLIYGREEIEPTSLWSVNNLLCLLSHSCPEETLFPWSLETWFDFICRMIPNETADLVTLMSSFHVQILFQGIADWSYCSLTVQPIP